MVFGFSPDFIQIVYNVVGSLVYTEQWVTMMAIVMVMGMGVDTITIIHLVVLQFACLLVS